MDEEKLNAKENQVDSSLFMMVHGHVLETAICRHKIRILENLLIKAGLTTKEELTSLFETSKLERLPIEFDRIEEMMESPVKLRVQGSDFVISGTEEEAGGQAAPSA